MIGSAHCMWEDLAAIGEDVLRTSTVIAVNQAGWMYDGRVDEWVTLHPEELGGWAALRRGPGDPRTWSRRGKQLVDECLPHWGWGSSGLYGVTVALDGLELSRVILAGIPIDGSPHAHAADELTWRSEVNIHRRGWQKRYDRLVGRVASMSGWTRELLGPPPAEWLA